MAQINTARGSGFFDLLTILFIGLKLTGHITWSWWAVLAPIWVPFLIILLAIILYAVFSKE